MSNIKVELKRLSENKNDVDAVQKVLESVPNYFERVAGHPPREDEALSLFQSCPADLPKENKYVYGIYVEDTLIGCMDLLKSYPTNEVVNLALLIVPEKYQGKGVGKKAYFSLESIIRAWGDIKKIRVGMVWTNGIVVPFWKKLGFVETGDKIPYQYGDIDTDLLIFEKNIEASSLNKESA